MKKRWIYQEEIKKSLFLIILVSAVLLLIYLIPRFNISGNVVSEDFSVINKEDLASYLEKQNIVKDLPKDALILVKLYNFDSGSREWEESYVLKKSEVIKGSIGNPDLIITINSKYVPELKDLCSAIKNAKSKGDLGYESKINAVKFLFRYGGMLKYKSCLGF